MNDPTAQDDARLIAINPPPMQLSIATTLAAKLSAAPFACTCPDCGPLLHRIRKYVSEGDVRGCWTQQGLNLIQATSVIRVLQHCGCDQCLQYAGELCESISQSLMCQPLASSLMHRLEQAHASTRDAIEIQRVRLWMRQSLSRRIAASKQLTAQAVRLHGLLGACNFINGGLEPIRFDEEFGNGIDEMIGVFVARYAEKE